MSQPPIKRNQHIVPLSQDHHGALVFCRNLKTGLENGTELSRMREYVDFFWNTHMIPHFTEEETILFVPLKDEMVMRALEEHQIIETLVRKITATKDPDPNDLTTLCNTLNNHVRFEERELFPHLEKQLSEQQLEEIGQALAAVQEDEAPACTYHDNFWERKK